MIDYLEMMNNKRSLIINLIRKINKVNRDGVYRILCNKPINVITYLETNTPEIKSCFNAIEGRYTHLVSTPMKDSYKYTGKEDSNVKFIDFKKFLEK